MSLAVPDGGTKEEIRATALGRIQKLLGDRLDGLGGEDFRSEVGADVRDKFVKKFSEYLSTAFDFLFKEDLCQIDEISEESLAEFSVNDDQLQEMDNAINEVSHRRKFYPARCSLFLDKTLRLKHDTEKKIPSNVKAVESLCADEGNLKNFESIDNSVQSQMKDLQYAARQARGKATKLERAFQILKTASEKDC